MGIFRVAVALAAVRLSVRTANEIGNLPISMQCSGRIFARDTNVTVLSGDVNSIRHQIIAINHNYAEENPLPDSAQSTRHGPVHVHGVKSTTLETRGDGQLQCYIDNGIPTRADDCVEGLNFLQRLENNEQMCMVNPIACTRMSCSNKCGINLSCLVDGGNFNGYCRDITAGVYKTIGHCGGMANPPISEYYDHGHLVFWDHYTELKWADCKASTFPSLLLSG